MLIKGLGRADAVEVFVNAFNAAGEQLSVGTLVCYDWRNATSHGTAVVKPTTSTLGLVAGAVAGGAGDYADIATNAYGLVQVFGVHGSFAYNVGAASVSCAGQYQIAVNGQYSGQLTDISGVGLSWTSQTLMIGRAAFLLSNDLSGSGWGQAFVRCL